VGDFLSVLNVTVNRSKDIPEWAVKLAEQNAPRCNAFVLIDPNFTERRVKEQVSRHGA
jgi:hypothetical protein